MKYRTAPSVSPIVYTNRPVSVISQGSIHLLTQYMHLAHAQFQEVPTQTLANYQDLHLHCPRTRAIALLAAELDIALGPSGKNASQVVSMCRQREW